ncbi:MAG: hypothetical protein WBS19_17805 [Candidatus Korobacteraceae bacterium]
MSYSFACNWQAGAIMDPANKHRVGYLTEFNGIGLPAALAKDLDVKCPYNNPTVPAYQGLGFSVSPPPVIQDPIALSVVATLQTVSWGGGAGDAFSFSCYMSQENAVQLKTLQEQTLRTTNISSIGWWITNYDPQPKLWFEELYPMSPAYTSAKINVVGNNTRLNVNLVGVQVGPTVGNYLYNVSFEIVPAAYVATTIHIASSSSQQVVRPWS